MGQLEQANLVTIIGMIAAFITASVTAFLAEPVKNYFTNKSKLHHLRVALYKEMWSNYLLLKLNAESLESAQRFKRIFKHALRSECYDNTLANEVSLFYQLEEANSIISFHIMISYLIGLLNEDDVPPEAFLNMCQQYMENYELHVHDLTIKPQVLKTFLTTKQYQELFNTGKELSKHEEQ